VHVIHDFPQKTISVVDGQIDFDFIEKDLFSFVKKRRATLGGRDPVRCFFLGWVCALGCAA
jgi:hypothetical protein